LPDLAKSLGRAMREFKKATNELKETMQIDGELAEVKKAFNDASDDVKETVEPKFKSETEMNDQPRIDTAEAEENKSKIEKSNSSSDDFDNLKNLKNAFDDLNSNSSAPDETAPDEATPADKSAAQNDEKEKLKGSVDDA
jgi:sec-independent protein translocase protein TatB